MSDSLAFNFKPEPIDLGINTSNWEFINGEFVNTANNEINTNNSNLSDGSAMNGWQKGALGINALTGLAGMFNAYKDYGLRSKQLAFNKALANRNLANSAVTTNQQLKNQAIMAAQLGGGHDYGTNAMIEAADRNYTPVSGAPVGLAAPKQVSLRDEIVNPV